MNKTFSEYTASASFNLTLSKRMVEFLLSADDGLPLHLLFGTFVSCGHALERRGLFKWDDDPKTGGKCNPHITEEGRQVAKLLRMAGHSIDHLKTNVA